MNVNVASVVSLMLVGGSTFAQQPAAEAAKHELVMDSVTRTSSLAEDSPSGWKNGKFKLTDGGPNTMNIGGLLQFRYNGNFREDQPDGSEYTGGFQVQRARLRLDGTVWDKAFSYNVMMEMASSSGAFLLDAEGRYTFENKAYVRFGQYKPLFTREEIISDQFQLDIERSVTNSVFTMARSQGIGAGWLNEAFRLGADITDGSNQLNSPWSGGTEADFAVTGRADWMIAGKDWKRFSDFTSWRGSEFAAMLGGAFDYETYGDTGGGATSRDLVKATADLSLEGNGWNAFAAILWQQSDPDSGPTAEAIGAVAQGGVFVADQVELYARYDGVFPNEVAGPDNFNTGTVGINYFVTPQSHAFRLSADFIYYFDPESECAIIPAPSTTLNLLQDDEGNQIAFRLQAQVIY